MRDAIYMKKTEVPDATLNKLREVSIKIYIHICLLV